MSDIIHLLPDSVANKIAAGEVVQRPASVVKELVENAVDAGATDIKIYIRDAGRSLIQVTDNGRGMSETDARMAFERHATSKIRAAEDLEKLCTMGFRGEALPSICAVSKVEVRTRMQGDSMGTCLMLDGPQVESQEPTMCDCGTTIMVKNLFFNLPARRKFLKSDNVELSAIMREFERLALVNNNLRMSISTGTREIQLRAGSLRQRIGDLWKGNLNMTLLPVEIDTALIRVSGYVSRPEYARRRNALQFMIVNGRNMRHPYFHKAVVSCYESLIASDTQPCYFLKFEVDPASIDVNVSPTKSEVKFQNELEIRPLLVAAVRASLGKNGAVPAIDFDSPAVEVAPLAPGEAPEVPSSGLHSGYNPFASQPSGFSYTPSAPPELRRGGASGRGAAPQAKGWESLYNDFLKAKSPRLQQMEQQEPIPDLEPDRIPSAPVVAPVYLQFAEKYIVTSSREGMIFIDQHRAHVKILYEENMSRAGGAPVSERVLFPEIITLDIAQGEALREVWNDLKSLGFVLEKESESTYRIEGVPAMRCSFSPREMILRILESVSDDSADYGKDDAASASMLSRMALMMARMGAIERGRVLSQEEMETLVSDLFRLPDPTFTPYGARIYCNVGEAEIASMLR